MGSSVVDPMVHDQKQSLSSPCNYKVENMPMENMLFIALFRKVVSSNNL